MIRVFEIYEIKTVELDVEITFLCARVVLPMIVHAVQTMQKWCLFSLLFWFLALLTVVFSVPGPT